MDTDTRIAELLGWRIVSPPMKSIVGGTDLSALCQKQGGEHLFANFTTDLNLTDRERERKGYGVSVMTHIINGQMIYEVDVFKFEDNDFVHTAEGKSLARTYASAFASALGSD